jgi:late competence protein required for DNA uptake (superfamily II DNA/RNA helicase)
MTEKRVVLKLRTFQTKIPISTKVGPELEHLGLIVYPHDRESCPGCEANRAIQEMNQEAIWEMARKVDEIFMGQKNKGRLQ